MHAELYFLSKKLDQIYNFCIALQRHFINKLTKNAYIKGPTKKQCTTIKPAFIMNYDDVDGNYNLAPSLEIAIKIWTP